MDGILLDFFGQGRKQFRGPDGLTGLLPKTSLPGDLICLLWGTETPVVLRPDGNAFHLVGDCFIQEYMTGGIYFLENPDKQCNLQRFDIR